MSLTARVATLLVAFAAVVGGAVFVVFHYIGGNGGTLPTVDYASMASGGQVNVALQEDPQNNSATKPDWVSYYVQDPRSKKWVHTTLFTLPADTTVRMTIYGYDGCTPLRNNFWSQVLGTTGGTVTVRQFQGTKPLGGPQTTSVINSWANCNVAHTFAIPSMHLFVPVASPNAENSANHLCSTSPCEPASGAHAVETFSFRTPSQGGVFRWQCLIPCGGGYIDGNGGPMQTFGYMTGLITVVR